MKPLHETAGYLTFDLTECRLHYVDGRLVVLKPSKWTKRPKQTMPTLKGEMEFSPYLVTEWEEVPLDVKVQA